MKQLSSLLFTWAEERGDNDQREVEMIQTVRLQKKKQEGGNLLQEKVINLCHIIRFDQF